VGLIAIGLVACGSSKKSTSPTTTAATTASTAAGAGSTATSAATAATTAPAVTTGATSGTEAAATTVAATSGSTGGGGTAGQAAADAAKARVAPFLEEVTKIPVSVPLKEKPAAGKKLYWLEGNIQSILPITGGFEAAAKALNWNLTTITYDPSDPQGPNAAMQQAVDAGADFIAISGQPVSAIETALAAAKAAKIPVFAMFGENEADPATGIVAVVGGLDLTADNAERLGDFVIADSGGKANVVIANLPDFTILQFAEKKLKAQFDSACTTCKYDTIETTIADLSSGAIPGQIVSYLQTHKDVNYVYLSIGDMATGLPEAMASAGIGRNVKIVGGVPNVDQIQSLIDNTSDAWMTLPRVSAAWQMVDAMARYDEGMDVSVSEVVPPRPIYTPKNVPSPAKDYAGVEGFEDQWKALWGVS
jgi:ribose transport system substrate-binding protein